MYDTTQAELQAYFAEYEALEPGGRILQIVTSWMSVQDEDEPRIDPADVEWLLEHCPTRAFSISIRNRLERERTDRKGYHVGDRWRFQGEAPPGEEDLHELAQICCWYFLEYLGHFFVPRSPKTRKSDRRPRIRRCEVCGRIFVAERLNNTMCSNACKTKASEDRRKKRKKVSK